MWEGPLHFVWLVVWSSKLWAHEEELSKSRISLSHWKKTEGLPSMVSEELFHSLFVVLWVSAAKPWQKKDISCHDASHKTWTSSDHVRLGLSGSGSLFHWLAINHFARYWMYIPNIPLPTYSRPKHGHEWWSEKWYKQYWLLETEQWDSKSYN